MSNYSTPYANLRGWTKASISDEDEPIVKDHEVKLTFKLGADYIKPLFVIVEMYDHKSYGKGKREYKAQFTDAERKTISKYYAKLYDWYLRRGIPVHGVTMRPTTYELLCRAANFFANL